MSSIPEIRINYSWLLKDDVSRQIAELNKWEIESDDQFEKWSKAYRMAWSKNEKVILTSMIKLTGLEFYLPVIDITLAPCIIPKSQPLIIGFTDYPETFIDTLTHELAHTLLCDNKILSLYGENRNFKLADEWKKIFGINHSFTTLVHIPVHALCQKIFEETLSDINFVQRDKKQLEEWGSHDYLKAWDYVEKEGADVIIEKLKESYVEIAKKLEKKI